MGNLQQLRMQSILGGYDQLTPGAGGGGNMGYSDEDYSPNPTSPYTPGPGLEQIGAQQGGGYVLGSEAESQPESIIQTPTIDPVGAPSAAPRSSVYDMMDAINKGYTPATSARDRYDALLNEAPQRNRPGILRTLAAGGLSLKAQDPVATTEKVMYAPYYRQQADWKEKAEPYFKAAELENRANINERTLVSNAVQAQTQADKLAENARQADQKAELTRQRNMIADYTARGLKVVDMPHSPTIWMRRPDGQPFNTGVPTGALTEAESIRSKGEWMEKAWDARADAANTPPVTVEMPDGTKKVYTFRGGKYEEATERTGAGPTGGVGTSVPMTAPGTTPGVPGTSSAGKPLTLPKGAKIERVDGTDGATAKALSPTQQRIETSNKIAGILSRHTDWNNYVNYNEDTKLYEGMGNPPQPPARGLFGLGGGSDEDWQRYKDDMDGYNYLRSLLHPNMPPYPTVGGSNAEQKAARAKEQKTTPPPATTTAPPSSTTSTAPTKGLGPSGSTNAAPTGSGKASIGPSNVPSSEASAPNNPKSLPGSGSTTSTTKSTTTTTAPPSSKTWMPESAGKYPFLPDWLVDKGNSSTTTSTAPKAPTPKTVPQAPIKRGSIADRVRQQDAIDRRMPEAPPEGPGRNTVGDQPYGTEPKPLPATAPPTPPGAELQEKNGKYRYTTDNRRTWYELRGNRWVKVGG